MIECLELFHGTFRELGPEASCFVMKKPFATFKNFVVFGGDLNLIYFIQIFVLQLKFEYYLIAIFPLRGHVPFKIQTLAGTQLFGAGDAIVRNQL